MQPLFVLLRLLSLSVLLSACGIGVDPFPERPLAPARVQVVVPPYPVIADGQDFLSIEVRFEDVLGREVPGVQPEFLVSGTGGTLNCGSSNARGIAICTFVPWPWVAGESHIELQSPLRSQASFTLSALDSSSFQYRIQGGGTVELPLHSGGTYSNLKVYWGDGSYSPIPGPDDQARFHTYADNSERIVTLNGSFDRLVFFGHQPERLLDVRYWGNNWSGITDMSDLFRGCTRLRAFSARDTPDTFLVTSFESTFEGAILFNGDVSDWDTAFATGFSRMFKGARSFNQDISRWSVSNVVDFSEMFSAENMDLNDPLDPDPAHPMVFNQSLTNWEVSSGLSFSKMFAGAVHFNQDLSPWNLLSATDLSGMFFHAHAFNMGDTSEGMVDWVQGNASNLSHMFHDARAFNQDIGAWDVVAVTNMSYLFRDAESFNQPLPNWLTDSLTDLKGMFRGASAFNQGLNHLNTRGVSDFSEVFMNASSFDNQGISFQWDTGSATNMAYMFFGTANYQQGFGAKFNVNVVTNFDSMFAFATLFNGDISTWDTGVAQNMSHMFESAQAFNGDLSLWDVGFVTQSSNFDLGASSWSPVNKPNFSGAR